MDSFEAQKKEKWQKRKYMKKNRTKMNLKIRNK